MNKYFTDDGVPSWLPGDFDPGAIVEAYASERTYLDMTKGKFIITIEMDSGMEIEKTFLEEEYPIGLESWQWVTNYWNASFPIQGEIKFTPE